MLTRGAFAPAGTACQPATPPLRCTAVQDNNLGTGCPLHLLEWPSQFATSLPLLHGYASSVQTCTRPQVCTQWYIFTDSQSRRRSHHSIITLVSSGVIEQKQPINPGTQKAPPGVWQGFSSLPLPGPVEAALQHVQDLGGTAQHGCSKTAPHKLISRCQTKPQQWHSYHSQQSHQTHHKVYPPQCHHPSCTAKQPLYRHAQVYRHIQDIQDKQNLDAGRDHGQQAQQTLTTD